MLILYRIILYIFVMVENNVGLGKYFYFNFIVWDYIFLKIYIENVFISYIDINGDILFLIIIDLILEENESEVVYC